MNRTTLSRSLLRIALAAAAVAAAGCGSDESATPATAGAQPAQQGPATGHVHAVGVDPADGAIVLAAHTGLFRAGRGDDHAVRLGDERRDVMGFTVEGPGQYAGSGHPDPRSGGPASVGFIRSSDAGRSWQTLSLEGEADLHVLEVAGRRVYGYNALSGDLLRSSDGGRTWDGTALPPVLDIAVDPEDGQHVVASAERGLLRSRDGGRSWRPLDSTPASLLVWRRDGLLRLGSDGTVRAAARLGAPARPVGTLPSPASAASLDGQTVLAALDDGTVLQSADAGRSWQTRLGPSR